MAIKEYAGAIIMELDGAEVEVVSLSATERTGKKPVKVMNRSGYIGGFARGVKEYELRITVAIPLEGDIDWSGIEGAKITQEPASPGGKRVSYIECVSTEIGEEYSVDNEARRDISLFAIKKVGE